MEDDGRAQRDVSSLEEAGLSGVSMQPRELKRSGFGRYLGVKKLEHGDGSCIRLKERETQD